MAWRVPIEYHVFGDGGVNFERWHPQLSNIIAIDQVDQHKDSIFFHPSIEETGISPLDMMDRIIISTDSQEINMLCLNKLLAAGVSRAIHIRGNRQLLRQLQYVPERQNEYGNIEIAVFGSDVDMYSREVIMHGELLQTAKATHVSYVRESEAKNIREKYSSCKGCINNGKCEECLHADDTWHDLIPFEKASNVASADHEQVKRYMIAEMDNHGGMESVKNELCRVEHERWCRFYYLHNWKYGKTTDKSARIHSSLLPFEVLSETEQEKDWWEYSRILREET